MDKKAFGKMKRYCVSGNKFVLYGVGIAAVIDLIGVWSQGAPILSAYTIIIVVVTVLLGGGLYMIGYVSVGKRFKERCAQLEKLGQLGAAVNDFASAERAYRDQLAFGQQFLYAKGSAIIFSYDETESMRLTEPRKDDGVSWIILKTNSSGEYTLCEVSSEKHFPKAQKAVDIFAHRKGSF